MNIKKFFFPILTLLLLLFLLCGCSSEESQSTAPGGPPLLTVISGETSVPAFEALLSGLFYSESGWVSIGGLAAEYPLREEIERLPTVNVTLDFKDFSLEYAPNTEALGARVFNTELKPVYEALYRPESLTVLPRGTIFPSVSASRDSLSKARINTNMQSIIACSAWLYRNRTAVK